MHRSILLLAIVGALLSAGCASMNPQGATAANAPGTDDDEKSYLTGSRIPVKDKTINARTTDKNTIDSIYRRAQVCTGGGACGGGN
ncbi:MAG: hypothetical protein ABI569_07180 [Casimicrobiaceae bacterium]